MLVHFCAGGVLYNKPDKWWKKSGYCNLYKGSYIIYNILNKISRRKPESRRTVVSYEAARCKSPTFTITSPEASPRSAVGPHCHERLFVFLMPHWLSILSRFHCRTRQHFYHIQANVYFIICASNAGPIAGGDSDPLIKMTLWIPYSRSAPSLPPLPPKLPA